MVQSDITHNYNNVRVFASSQLLQLVQPVRVRLQQMKTPLLHMMPEDKCAKQSVADCDCIVCLSSSKGSDRSFKSRHWNIVGRCLRL